jgi:hypothetical protein
MRTWLFQSVPSEFRLVEFLATSPRRARWKCTRFSNEMRGGDRVYLWQAIGDGSRDMSGIFAKAHVLEAPAECADTTESAPFWIDESIASLHALRVLIGINQCQVLPIIPRAWFEDDPVLESSTILSVKTGSNFRITTPQRSRIDSFWPKA